MTVRIAGSAHAIFRYRAREVVGAMTFYSAVMLITSTAEARLGMTSPIPVSPESHHRFMKQVTVLAPFLAVLLAAMAPIDVTADVAHKLDLALTASIGRDVASTPALEVAITEHGRIVYDRTFGYAQTGTRFRIASISKAFTAVAIEQLVEQHRVALDATVSTYLPGVPHANEVTIRELLRDGSGLAGYSTSAFTSGASAYPIAPSVILELLNMLSPDAGAGPELHYGDTGYLMLGLVVERVTGQTLARYERTNIFNAAGLLSTNIDGDRVPVVPGYLSANGPIVPPFAPQWLYGSGDILSTAADVARFDDALMDGALVSAATFATMQADELPIGNRGRVPGFSVDNVTVPRDELAFVVLSDAYDYPTAQAIQRIAATLYPDGSLTPP